MKSKPVNGETPSSPPLPNEPTTGETRIVDIDPQGDLVLNIKHGTADHQFRASTAALKTNSKYFSGLLQGRFGESERIEKSHAELKSKYGSPSKSPAAELPIIYIEDIGRISAVKSIEPLCTDFLTVLHGKEPQTSLPPVANLANLAIVADRFDSLDAVRAYVRRRKIPRAIDGKTTPKAENSLSEEKVRQRVLVAVLLDYGPWLEKYSARMITKGWVGKEATESAALWWDLPSRLEEELAFRRDSILDTFQSLQAYFLRLYTSRERQCKLGYDSSAQCDSFQLGEMIRFFTRSGTLQLQGTILDTAEPPLPYEGDIFNLVDLLRQVPEYQIDRNHSHCGIRTRLIPLLDLITESLYFIGICPECWSQSRIEHAWMEGKPPLTWKRQSHRLRNSGHKELHANVGALFTATDRDWAS
ncbi:hypothetical protein M409DRAFT_21742 [Zasmidium cellare ATCC 36951]|uniref:BTB domain-containing protein n=1 Tax=Zasmidium cellare ATCC 36951 TaxID=1080233 RepID=A0A6A6CMC4_ZASCE|nr:uncharacterized protein M409DRAFT_21742 [Zasmidium cellare ATCC 36951]KAF2168305.1 hypothetical protein M409DRAFT_21742 [Zasmidium cellare ATCC 36951]